MVHGLYWLQKSVGNYFSCLTVLHCTWGPRSELLLVWPLNKWGKEILLRLYFWWDKAFRLTSQKSPMYSDTQKFLQNWNHFKFKCVLWELVAPITFCDQFHSLCEFKCLTIIWPLVRSALRNRSSFHLEPRVQGQRLEEAKWCRVASWSTELISLRALHLNPIFSND